MRVVTRPFTPLDIEWLIKAIDLQCARLAAAILAQSRPVVVLNKSDRDRFGLVAGAFYFQMRTLERNGLLRCRKVENGAPYNWEIERLSVSRAHVDAGFECGRTEDEDCEF